MRDPGTAARTACAGRRYIGLSFVLWLVAEYVTVWHTRPRAWLGLMLGLELLWRNPLLLNPAMCVPAALLLASIWGFLTFLPLWLVEGTLRRRRLPAVLCCLWIAAGATLACAGWAR